MDQFFTVGGFFIAEPLEKSMKVSVSYDKIPCET